MFSRKPKICRNPVGDGVHDVPPTRSPPTPPRSAGPRRGGVPPQPGASLPPPPTSPQPPCRGRRPRRPTNEIKTPPVAAFSPVPTPRPAPCKSSGTRPDLVATRRGRRPRRPFPSSTADLTTFHKPPVGAGFHPRPASDYCERYGVARAAGGGAARKGGTPGEGSPFNPLLRFVSTRRVPRAAARGQGSAPGPRPLFCKKAGQKTFRRQSTSSPNPSPWRRVIQSVREADTLAAGWQLPREWERRVGPETSRGRHHPKSVFLWGSTPFLWARPKKWGGTGSVNAKPTNSKTASS